MLASSEAKKTHWCPYKALCSLCTSDPNRVLNCTHLCNLCKNSVYSAKVINECYILGFFSDCSNVLNVEQQLRKGFFFFILSFLFLFFSGHSWYTWKWWSDGNEGDVFFSFSCGQLVSHLLLSRGCALFSFTKLSELHAFYSL